MTCPEDEGRFPWVWLFWTAVINGVIVVPIMVATMHIVSTSGGHRKFAVPRWLRTLGWLATALMAVTVAVFAWLAVF